MVPIGLEFCGLWMNPKSSPTFPPFSSFVLVHSVARKWLVPFHHWPTSSAVPCELCASCPGRGWKNEEMKREWWLLNGTSLLLVLSVDLVHAVKEKNALATLVFSHDEMYSLRPLCLLGPPPGGHGEPSGPALAVTHTEGWVRERERGT